MMRSSFAWFVVFAACVIGLMGCSAPPPSSDGETVSIARNALLSSSCAPFFTENVGSYTVEANYWNEGTCPGTQCMTVDGDTGAFSVSSAASCASTNTVASYPNTLYGTSFGNSSPGSVLPLPVSALTSVTSSWSFSVGGASTDAFDVAYDIWFCPNNTCGTTNTSFIGGTELMIWLDYQNVGGWQNNLGSVTLGGYNFQVWQATMGSPGSTWTYVAYLLQGPALTSVSNLDLLSFFQDAEARGLIQNSSYLYAVQAGDEIRTGGMPFTSNSFSVSVNGPSSSACTSQVVTSSDYLSVAPPAGTSGSGWEGYAWTLAQTQAGAPSCTGSSVVAPGASAPFLGELSGVLAECPNWGAWAMVQFNLDQAIAGGAAGTWTVPSLGGVTVTFENPDNAEVRLVLNDTAGNQYCANITSGVETLWSQFATNCWTSPNVRLSPGTALSTAAIQVVETNNAATTPYDICVQNIALQGACASQVVTASDYLQVAPPAGTSGPGWEGYAWTLAQTLPGAPSCAGSSTIAPSGSAPFLGELSGVLAECSNWGAWAMVQFNLDQAIAGGTAGTWTVPATGGVTVTFQDPDNAAVRLVLNDTAGNQYCANITSGVETPWSKFAIDCWASPNVPLRAGTALSTAAVQVVETNNAATTPYDICVQNIVLH